MMIPGGGELVTGTKQRWFCLRYSHLNINAYVRVFVYVYVIA